jgi:hypothetical protein
LQRLKVDLEYDIHSDGQKKYFAKEKVCGIRISMVVTLYGSALD